ncbi:hypothetical protein V3C99_015184 [Haemonchus contortus]
MSRRLLFVTFVHGFLSQFGDILMSCLNLLNVPIRRMFNQSISEHYGPVENQEFEWIYAASASTMMLGLVIGFFIMGDLMDRFGRKETAIVLRCLLGLSSAVAMILSFITSRFEFYVFGHFLVGIVAALKVVLLIYLAECSPDDKRGFTSMVVNSGGVLMVLVLTPLCLPSLTGSDSLWCLLPLLCALMAIAHLLIAIRFPQSPKQLYIQEYKEQEARAALQFYYGDHYNIDEAIEEMETERLYESHKNVSLKDILGHGTYRYCFFLVLFCAFLPTCSALNMKLQYLVSWLISYGMSQSQATSAMTAISIVSLPLCFVSPLFIERCGRRKVFILIAALCTLEWVFLGMAQLLHDAGATNPKFSQLLSVFGATLGQCAVNLGLLVMAPMMISEVCPHNTRATISQLTQVLPAAVGTVEVLLFPHLRSCFGAGIFFFFSACCALLVVALYRKMVETTGMPVDYIVRQIHSVYSRKSTAASEGGNYGALFHESSSLLSMHHGVSQQ